MIGLRPHPEGATPPRTHARHLGDRAVEIVPVDQRHLHHAVGGPGQSLCDEIVDATDGFGFVIAQELGDEPQTARVHERVVDAHLVEPRDPIFGHPRREPRLELARRVRLLRRRTVLVGEVHGQRAVVGTRLLRRVTTQVARDRGGDALVHRGEPISPLAERMVLRCELHIEVVVDIDDRHVTNVRTPPEPRNRSQSSAEP